ncbi:hypothetical protein TELCIR_09519 [Teladorsagia circumcincta]|uniref:Uncharacterized protein n=1 Tax=Teladorsagia circumcincta TaxID=45464 RepID=A0A2G9UG28_TELCI|nr:hypothetical protein TELCIR_09519 [Teladorsagia circumcincta]
MDVLKVSEIVALGVQRIDQTQPGTVGYNVKFENIYVIELGPPSWPAAATYLHSGSNPRRHAKETNDHVKSNATNKQQYTYKCCAGNLHFQQDPNDPQKWIITNDSAATTPSTQPSNHSHNQSARMTGGGDSPNMMVGEYEMGIDDTVPRQSGQSARDIFPFTMRTTSPTHCCRGSRKDPNMRKTKNIRCDVELLAEIIGMANGNAGRSCAAEQYVSFGTHIRSLCRRRAAKRDPYAREAMKTDFGLKKIARSTMWTCNMKTLVLANKTAIYDFYYKTLPNGYRMLQTCIGNILMSWITKVSDLAGKAEDLLNRLDQTTSEAIQNQKARSNTSKPARSNSYAHLKSDEGDGEVHTEEMGRSGPSLPSRTHSEFAGGAAAGRKRIHDRFILRTSSKKSVSLYYSFIPSTSVVSERERRDDELIAMLNDEIGNDADDTRSRRSSGRKQPLDLSQIRSQLWAKESQIAAMRSKISELERKLTKRSDEFYELMAEKDMIAQRLAQQSNSDSVEELKLARKKAQDQRDVLLEECTQLKRKCMAHEEEVRAMGEQLRLAKFNLSENKKEFDQYKEKAQKILQAKEKLVDSLKAEQNTGDSADRLGHPLQAELEEMRVERDLARADLESAQLMVYNLRSEIEEMENQLREEQIKQSEQRRQYLEEKQSWHATVALLNEKVDCARIESEFAKQEMKRQNEDFARKLESQEAELRKNVEDQRASDKKLRSNLVTIVWARKSVQVVAVKAKHKQARQERRVKSARETVIPIDPPSASLPIHHPAAKQAVTCFFFEANLSVANKADCTPHVLLGCRHQYEIVEI